MQSGKCKSSFRRTTGTGEMKREIFLYGHFIYGHQVWAGTALMI